MRLTWTGAADTAYTVQQDLGSDYRILTLTTRGETMLDLPEEGATYRVRACWVSEDGVIQYLEIGRAITLRTVVTEPETPAADDTA